MSDLAIAIVSDAVAVALALGAWAIADIGMVGFARYRATFTERTRFDLREMFMFVDPSRLFALNLAAMLLGGLGAWIIGGNGVLAAAIALGIAFVPRLLLRWMRARRAWALEQQLPDALLMLSGGLRAGVSLAVALAQLVREGKPPLSQEFDLVLREQRLGISVDESLDNLHRRVPDQSMTLAISAMRIAAETGGGLAEALERVSATLRAKLAMEGKIRALTSQGKLQAWVVGALPVFLLLVLSRMEPRDMGLMFTTRMGWATLAVIIVLEFFGIWIIRKIVDIDV
ncbi:type II secretion system F family protein [soil metagenome]